MYVIDPEIVDMNRLQAPAVDPEILTLEGLGQHVDRRGWVELGQLMTVDEHGNIVPAHPMRPYRY
jgi:hypothetical protein